MGDEPKKRKRKRKGQRSVPIRVEIFPDRHRPAEMNRIITGPEKRV